MSTAVRICTKCSTPCEDQAVTVNGKAYHKKCVVCSVCFDSLDNGVYEYNNQLLCPADYNSLYGKKCGGCQQYVTGEYTTVENVAYHFDCLKCAGCLKVISAGDSFGESSSGYVCDSCADLVCPVCDKPTNLSPNVVCRGEVDGWYHITCLQCNTCQKPLDEKTFHPFNGKPYCEKHHTVVADTTVELANYCHTCKKRIDGNGIKALQKQYHEECFNCKSCKNPITGPFLQHEGNLYDQPCYEKDISPKCEGCKKPITGSYMDIAEKSYHPECILCVVCHKGFGNGQNIRYHKEKPHHIECLVCFTCKSPFMAGENMYIKDDSVFCSRCK